MKATNSHPTIEVALLGANTVFGTMTSFLLKQSPNLSKLLLYDDKAINVCNDIEFINTACRVNFLNGSDNLSKAIKSADIIIIGDDNAKEMTHECVFLSRAPIILNYIKHIASYNPNAFIVLATTPVNMTFPLVAKMLKILGKWNEKKVIGMTNVENIRARCIFANHLQISPRAIDFPVIGGTSSETRVPLLSTVCPYLILSKTNLQKITCAVKTFESKLHTAKGSPESLNRAYATSCLVESLISALNGQEVVETVLSYQNVVKDIKYFSLPVILGEEGIKKHLTFSKISQHEKHLLSHAIKCMAADAKKAEQYVDKFKEKLNILCPLNKLNNLKWQKEENYKTKALQPKLIHNENRLADTALLSHENLESKLCFKGKVNQKLCETAVKDLTSIPYQKCKDSISNSIHSKSESKFPMCSNEDITYEINETLGIDNSHHQINIRTYNLSESAGQSEEVSSSDSNPVANSQMKPIFNSHSRTQENIMVPQDKENLSVTKEKIALGNISGNHTVEPLHTIKDNGYSLPGIPSSINKLPETLPTKNILEGDNSGLIIAKYDFSSIQQLNKEQEGPDDGLSIVADSNKKELSHGDSINGNTNKVMSMTEDIKFIKKQTTAEYLTLKNRK